MSSNKRADCAANVIGLVTLPKYDHGDSYSMLGDRPTRMPAAVLLAEDLYYNYHAHYCTLHMYFVYDLSNNNNNMYCMLLLLSLMCSGAFWIDVYRVIMATAVG